MASEAAAGSSITGTGESAASTAAGWEAAGLDDASWAHMGRAQRESAIPIASASQARVRMLTPAPGSPVARFLAGKSLAEQ